MSWDDNVLDVASMLSDQDAINEKQFPSDEATSWWSWDLDELTALRREISQLKDQLVRSQADYANLVRRNREESLQIGQWSEEKTILKFLPILDDLERSLDHIPEDMRENVWIQGQISVVRRMQKVIADFWIVSMETLGKEIDPDLHEVVSQIPHTTTTIQADIEKGYIRWDRVIRHAKVVVGDGEK